MLKRAIITVIAFLIAAGVVLGILHYFKILALIALLIGFGVLVVIVVSAVFAGLALILALPYFMVTKEPEVDTTGDYRLEDVEDKRGKYE